MATYYYRPVNGNWKSAGTWSNSSGGASNGLVPTATTDCVLDAGSGAFTLTANGTSGAPALCRSLVCTGFAGTLAQGVGSYIDIGDGTAGNLTLVAGMTYAPSDTSFIRFKSTTTGNQITTAGKRMGSLTFDGVGGAWTLQDALDPVASAIITLTNGSFSTGSFNVGASSGTTLSSSNSNTRTLTLGTTTWTMATGSTNWNIGTSTNMTLSAASSTIVYGGTANSTTFAGGGLTYGTLTSTAVTTGTLTITGANTFGTLTTSCGATTKTTTSGYSLGANQTVTGTWTANGNSVILRNFIYSNTVGTARTITAGTVTVTHCDFRDITGAGAGSWDLSAITGGSGDCGGNSGITFTTPATSYWVTSGGTSTGSMSAVTRWASTSGGTAGTGRAPLPQDTSIWNASSIDAGSRTITNDMPRVGTLTWTGVTNTPAFASGANAFECYGSVTLVAGMTHTGAGAWTFAGRANNTLDGGGLTWPTSSTITMNCTNTYSITLQSNFTSNANINTTSGTIDFNGKATSHTTSNLAGGKIVFGATAVFTGSAFMSLVGGTIDWKNCTVTGLGTLTLTNGTIISGTSASVTVGGNVLLFTAAAAGGLAANPLGGFVR